MFVTTFPIDLLNQIVIIHHCVCNANLHSAARDVSVLYDYITSSHIPMFVALQNGTNYPKINCINTSLYHALTEHIMQSFLLDVHFFYIQ